VRGEGKAKARSKSKPKSKDEHREHGGAQSFTEEEKDNAEALFASLRAALGKPRTQRDAEKEAKSRE
jgi:hypothetical protein